MIAAGRDTFYGRAAAFVLLAAVMLVVAACSSGGGKNRKAALTTSTPTTEENSPPSGPSGSTQSASAELPSIEAGKPPKQETGPPSWASTDNTVPDAKAAPDPSKKGSAARGVESPPATAPAHDFKTLDEAVAAGNLDRAVADSLQQNGTAEAIVTIAYQSIINSAEANAPKGKGHGKAVIDSMQPAFKTKKDDVLGGRKGVTILREWPNLPSAYVKFDSTDALLGVLNAAGVLSVEADHTLHIESTQHLSYIRQPEVQSAGYIGSGTYVGVLDTGVNYSLSDFGTCPTLGTSSCKVQAYKKEVSGDSSTLDDSGHGSNVASIVTQVAPGTKIFAFDVFSGSSTGYQYVNTALSDLMSYKSQGYNVVAANMSLGGAAYHLGCPISFYAASIAATRAAGILPVVAAGNHAGGGYGTFGLSDPACAPASLAVGATYDASVGSQAYANDLHYSPGCTDSTTSADRIACFSQTDDWLDMLAPGTQIPGGGSGYWTGTSQAAPHVAGAAAVLAAAVPSASADQIQSALTSTGPVDTDQRYTTTVQVHRLDLAAARSALAASTGDTTKPVVSGPTERIDGQMTSTTVQVLLSWSATDASGIKAYDLWSKTDSGNWYEETLSPVTTTSWRFALAIGHTYQFGIYAQDGAGNWSNFSAGPTFTVDAQDDTSSAVTWSGTWSRYAWSDAFGGYGVASSSTGATCKFGPFTGRGVAFVAPYFSTAGQAKIYVDGVYQRTIDLYNASLYPRWVADSYRWSTSGSHTISVQVVGTSGRPRVDVDAFAVLR